MCCICIYYLLTRADDDGGGLVINGHGAVVGGHREPASHLVEAAVHHGLSVTPMTPGMTRVLAMALAGVLAPLAVVGINLDAFLGHFQTSINAL